MAGRFHNIVQKQYLPFVLLVIITLLVTAQSYLQEKGENDNGHAYTQYNNYIIFKSAWFHLADNKDLYKLYPEEHWDYYKYSPTFALLMAPLAYLPDAIGLFLWNLLNGLVFLMAMLKLPFRTNRQRLLALAFVALELIGTLQNEQSNPLVAGLIIFAFISLENKRNNLAAFFITLSVFIKLFGLVAFVLYLFYPKKLWSVIYTIGWFIVFWAIPLLVVSPGQLLLLYKSWLALLFHDQSVSYGLSVAGWLHSWFQFDLSKNVVVVAGIIIFCLPLLKKQFYASRQFRMLQLASILIWVVIFNHKAESPTYIIAVSGVAIWFFTQKFKTENLALLILVFLLVMLVPTDLFPRSIHEFSSQYVLKAIPCILVWFKLIYDMMGFNDEHADEKKIAKEPLTLPKGN